MSALERVSFSTGWSQEPFLPATLDLVRRCPARSEYIELCFSTSEGAWKWCFPEPPVDSEQPAGALALKLGPYGVQAHAVLGDGIGVALPSASAVPMILAGTPVYVACKLVCTAN